MELSRLRSSFLLLLVSITIGSDAVVTDERKVHIVYMGELPTHSEYSPTSHHKNILEEILEGSLVEDVIVHNYKRSFNGFAAKLTEQEVQKLSGMQGIVSVFPSRKLQLHTTRSWDFMGFPETVKRVPTVESDTIVGILDTGIWPELESFRDEGFGPPPKKWKGVCQGGENFTCNNKLIGARGYPELGIIDLYARDFTGHGTHAASIVAGGVVKDASVFGLAKGNARGAVPSARIAVYKVCSISLGCQDVDILRGFDDAIADGVDIISISAGPLPPSLSMTSDFDKDPIAIGSFHAIQKGILTSQSAGNNGPQRGTVSGNAPWVLTVAASSTDRRIIDKVVLGNGHTLEGTGINSFKLNGTKIPLLYGANVSSKCSIEQARSCTKDCLDKDLVKGKIVVCDGESKCDQYPGGGLPQTSGNGVQEAFHSGALGTIMVSDGRDGSFIYPLPGTLLSNKSGEEVKSYIRSNSKNAVGTILNSESIQDSKAPVVASFSSRGPNVILPDIIKPDITAPGVDILAGFSPAAEMSCVRDEQRSVKYNIQSGTSMSCSHATGAAAYVKTFHPEWSPSAIKSALMTTAFVMNTTKNQEGEFAYGSGHIDPVKAVNPGLVYETLLEDYVNMLFDLGYDSTKVKLITNSICPKCTGAKGTSRDLNYPSLGAQVEENVPININFKRTVTNVGLANSTYNATIKYSDDRIKVIVNPNVLKFKSLMEKKSFTVSVVGKGLRVGDISTAVLVWSDGIHSVRSPIVIHSKIASSPPIY